MTEAELRKLARKILGQHQKREREGIWIHGHLYVGTDGLTRQETNGFRDLGVAFRFKEFKTWMSHTHLEMLS